MASRSDTAIEQLFGTAKQIMVNAQICQEEQRDEMAWSMFVVKPALEWEVHGEDCATAKLPFLRLECM